jgi:hypothetical protein
MKKKKTSLMLLRLTDEASGEGLTLCAVVGWWFAEEELDTLLLVTSSSPSVVA